MKSFSFFSFDHMLILLLLLSLWFSFSQPLCHDDERSSLLQFKQSFAVEKFASSDPRAYPKAASWTGEGETGDCCRWDGVECDSDTGHVIGLDLSSSLLYGTIDSNNSLFSLVHLEMLNLSDNHFNYSQIPFSIIQLSKLSYLDLSFDAFSGQVPPEISELRNLSTLDLSFNHHLSSKQGLSLIQNMTRLEAVDLSFVNLSSQFPTFLANFSSLTSLYLRGCGMRGNLPVEIFQLPNLRILNLRFNDLTGELPPFNKSSSLQVLNVAANDFSGELPASIGELSSLIVLDAHSCNLSGAIPVSIGKLNKSSSLQVLNVAANDFSGELPASIGELSSLIVLDAYSCNLSGAIPVSIGKLNQLEFLSFSENNFWGLIPSFLENLTQITYLYLEGNHFSGQIPPLFSKLKNLDTLDLAHNDLSGTVNFDMFLALKNLTRLTLSYNNLSVLIEPGRNETLPQFTLLDLAFCTLSSFPYFLRHQTRMEILLLRRTHIGGLIPQWFMNISRTTMYHLNLAENYFTGEVSPNICNLKFLSVLHLYGNKLFGKLPSCLGNFSNSLMILNLRGNSFSGNIPEFGESSQLQTIDFSDNHLEGKLPRSLKNCKALGELVLGSNRITDVFPYWLGKIPALRVLMLGSNRFHGVIEEPQTDLDFPQLLIIDISDNAFTGKLPSKYIQNLKAMKRGSERNSHYMSTTSYRQSFTNRGVTKSFAYPFQVMITIKGVKRYYDRINVDLAVIDFSHNYFDGEIPEVIGNLKALHAIRLSSNNLSGGIPSSLGNLSELESLDLSQNMLSGEIPQELTKLNFLQYFNVSHNRLTGPIPQANQLSRFDASSYEGNLGLCGIPLPDKCGNSDAPSSSNALEDKQEDSFGIGWKVVAIGYACGFLAGVFMGNVVITRRPRWFAMVFRVMIVRATRKRSVGSGN